MVLEVSEDGYACGGLTKGIVDLPLGMLWGIDAVREGRRNQEKGWTLGDFNNKQRRQNCMRQRKRVEPLESSTLCYGFRVCREGLSITEP